MKRAFLISGVIIVLILDWLALDDITTGEEPSFFGEYAILIASVMIIPLIYYFWKKSK
ncbi:MAG: hypothetical protein Q7T54_05340 [Candidatus Levybacteria bacterium]|nr:hypothetical protein [Candidatus Levybacteria bacterium]